jgi:hypothetical protein
VAALVKILEIRPGHPLFSGIRRNFGFLQNRLLSEEFRVLSSQV